MKKAFSMIEMIFAIAVIGILSAIAIPKMMANKETAQLVQLKEQVEAIRKGIETYAGNQYLEKGFKEYPKNTLCAYKNPAFYNNMTCKGAKVFADKVATGIHRRAANSIGWDNFDEDLIFVTNPKNKRAVFFNYDENLGTFKCDTSKARGGWAAENCSIIGE